MLNAQRLAELVYFDHLVEFPDAAGVVRENPATGIPPHNPAYEFIYALAKGLVDALAVVTVEDLGSGTDDTDGTAGAVSFTIPRISSYVTQFLTDQNWTGEYGPAVADIFIGSMLRYVEDMAYIQMSTNTQMGTGTSTISPTTNPRMQGQLYGLLMEKIEAAMQASGYFARDDIPGNPVNSTVIENISAYATVYSQALGNLTATVSYSGVGGGGPVSNVANTGGFL